MFNRYSRIRAYKIDIEGPANNHANVPANYMFTQPLALDATTNITTFHYINNPNLALIQDPKMMYSSAEIRKNFRKNSCLK